MAQNTAEAIFYIGILYLAYLSMKSWGIVSVSNVNNWKPLTEQEFNNLRLH